jgi:murein L,D-transpeptidase YcbB/YkuD
MIAAIAGALAGAESARAADFAAELRTRVGALLADANAAALGETLRERTVLARFYGERSGAPAWIEQGQLRELLARDLLAALQQSERHGLRAADYHAEALERELSARDRDVERLAALELVLSDGFVHLARDLDQGAVDPRALDPKFERAPEPVLDTARLLAAALEAGKIADALAQSAPPQPEYGALIAELARQRESRARGDADAAARADQVRANLERWRWLPRDLGTRHLRVNVAGFGLEAFDQGRVALAMRVVVGEKDWNTPLAHGAISHIVLNPAWNVPRSIATREMLPAARRDRGYFRAKGIQVFPAKGSGEARPLDPSKIDWRRVDADAFAYRLRQPPGPHNPLGRIKFVFANPYGVYLHGTPGDLAFARGLRALSHGCVRVEDEIALAEFALAPDPTWTHERLLETLKSAWEYRLPLPRPLPVHLLYFTATVGADGAVRFGRDPYGWDRDLIAALGPDPARAATASYGSIHTGVPIALRAATKSTSASESAMQP